MMGCIGKITSYIETPDYRIVLNLEGVCRFILKSIILIKEYLSATIETKDFHDDTNSIEPQIDRNNLIQNTQLFRMKKLEIDTGVLSET